MIRNIIFIGLIAIVLIFVVQNTQVVEFQFLMWTVSMSRALMLFGALVIGLIAGWLLTFPGGKAEQHANRKQKK